MFSIIGNDYQIHANSTLQAFDLSPNAIAITFKPTIYMSPAQHKRIHSATEK